MLKLIDLEMYKTLVSDFNFKFGEKFWFKQLLKDINNPHFSSNLPIINNNIKPIPFNVISSSIIELNSPDGNLSSSVIQSSHMKSSKKKLAPKRFLIRIQPVYILKVLVLMMR